MCVLGAGPGGATAAIHLAKAGISCLVVDRAVFPRDKICGDGIGNGVIQELVQLNPTLLTRLTTSADQLSTWGVHFGAPNGRRVSLPAEPAFNKATDSPGGYTMKRLDFDALLVDEMAEYKNIEFLQGCNINQHQRTADGR
jgi:flavin-dependent dehydrogenase